MSICKHILLELYCTYEWENTGTHTIPNFCCYGIGNPGYHCIECQCKYVSYTYAPNEISYAGELGEVQDGDALVGFGGDMVPIDDSDENIRVRKELWRKICKNKILEAYKEYMNKWVK